ncbi:PAS domain S-box-containing protein [Natronospira proteinivora]|uniref:histidine kinase n=1 Tax=Natronospira proteinivora TaxID=1807133 RepID=A0ABT1GBW3_9GAMM|nr:PAS domain-containing hybrid sensor histidine kinase/response regulator [Natronospira proteinivora]MCP1728425.1 PAS domain S-box-containing protein [Natronospira proteinivora]
MTLLLIMAALAYIALLFLVAAWGERSGSLGQHLSRGPWVYGLAIAIYCTSWTYYGAVENASQQGWAFLPILLGPMLLFLLGLPLLQKLVSVSRRQNVNSIADFIASRYGKRHSLALVVTLIAAAAIIPYVALQLKALAISFTAATGEPILGTEESRFELVVALLMAAFAIFFGTRRVDVTQHRGGMMLAIAFESTLKLTALLLAAAFAFWLFMDAGRGSDSGPVVDAAIWSPAQSLGWPFLAQMFMAAGAIICLPRQFHVMVVDNVDSRHLVTARWLFPLYLALTALAIAVLGLLGPALLPDARDMTTVALQLPLEQGQTWLMLLVYLGGISAATAMVIVATITLSTMISNDVIMPMLLKRGSRRMPRAHRFYQRLLLIRRLAIVGILLLAWLCYHLWAAQMDLVSIGLLAFSLVLLLFPAVIGGIYWQRGHAHGVYAGLAVGVLVWVLAVAWPLVQGSNDPTEVITAGTMLSILLNGVAYVLVSRRRVPSLTDRVQATAFVQAHDLTEKDPAIDGRGLRNEDLQLLLITFLGGERADELLQMHERSHGRRLRPGEQASTAFVDFVERAIAGVLGAATARSLIRAALTDENLKLEQVVSFFDDTTQALQNQQSILFNSLENLQHGISVVDAELRLVAWNKAYLDLFDYPPDLVQPGRHISELIRFNAERGECGPGDLDELVNRRLQHMQDGSPHRFIRRRSDGRVIEMVGNPLPNGGFVTSFSDVTEHIETQQALEEANIDLKARIDTRSEQVRDINRELTEEIERRRETEQALQQAKAEAEEANASKTRFLALASHDILQPLNAAKLYLSAVDQSGMSEDNHRLLSRLDTALGSTEDLLSTLLAIAKMEQGAMRPNFRHVRLPSVLEPLIQEYGAMAENKGLILRTRLKDCVVHTDPLYLRRIVQNFLSNAVKYTQTGGVLLGVRQRGETIRVSVWDTGPGIAQAQHQRVFDAFIRLNEDGESGVGLGLSVAQRMGEQLDSGIYLRSRQGRGSQFAVDLPQGDETQVSRSHRLADVDQPGPSLTVLCVDDDGENLTALQALLERWGCKVECFLTAKEALAHAETQTEPHQVPDLLLLDYQLGAGMNGLALAEALRSVWGPVPVAIVTAMRDADLKQRCQKTGAQLLAKPVKPARLRALINYAGSKRVR